MDDQTMGAEIETLRIINAVMSNLMIKQMNGKILTEDEMLFYNNGMEMFKELAAMKARIYRVVRPDTQLSYN